MAKVRCTPTLLAAGLLVAGLGAGCGGGSGDAARQGDGAAQSTPPAATQTPPAMPAAPTAPVTLLKPPQLAFTDTGLSVSDGITRNGLWSVSSDGQGWEYSLDQGRTWIRGSGDSFEVTGDGPKMIWVRAVDGQGNTSDIVMVTCVLDTTAPSAVSVSTSSSGASRVLQLAGLEPGAQWEYALDGDTTWSPGSGTALAVLGNDLPTVALRQVDTAGNPSPPQFFQLAQPASDAWHEASGNPLQPSVLAAGAARTLLVHGSVVRGDADFVRWDIPAQHRLQSLRLVRYQSEDLIAFYAVQRAAVFDAGVDVNRMLVYGHMGPGDLMKNVVSAVPADQLGAGPMTLWFQQTGPLPTRYAIEVVIQPLP